jgi:hypothetical protein
MASLAEQTRFDVEREARRRALEMERAKAEGTLDEYVAGREAQIEEIRHRSVRATS